MGVGVLLEVVGYEPRDVIRAAANRRECGPDVLKRLRRLRPESLRWHRHWSGRRQRRDDADR